MIDAEPRAMSEAVREQLRPVFLCQRAVVSAMIGEAAGQVVGVIGKSADDFEACAQASAIGLTASLAEEVSQYGIRVQTVTCDPMTGVTPQRVAEVVHRVLTLPMDVTLGHVSVSPTATARRKRKRRAGREHDKQSAGSDDNSSAPKGSETERPV
jgi:NADP-dependent 3-hydroxy acid dehydrogenase YdfG